ncbi:MAG: 50S ribosomal protein L13 [Chlamydiae bacterium]|nr:50S ribosomal protein L13 [Chlamydiota bacterium]
MEKNYFIKTAMLTKEEAEQKTQWFLFDAKGKTLGRLSSEIAKVLRGKHRVDYTPHVDSGDGVVVINADKFVLTGNKTAQKNYYHHTGFLGGLKETPFLRMMDKKPTEPLRHAIWGMMPKTKLSKKQMKKLRLFASDTHTMQAQKPTAVNLEG